MLRAISNLLSSVSNAQAALGIGQIYITTRAIDFNSANTDTAIPITLPAGITRYRVGACIINGASASLTTATCGMFSAAAGGGTALVASATAITVNTASENTATNLQSLTIVGLATTSVTHATLYFRVQTPQGSAATGNVTLLIQPMS